MILRKASVWFFLLFILLSLPVRASLNQTDTSSINEQTTIIQDDSLQSPESSISEASQTDKSNIIPLKNSYKFNIITLLRGLLGMLTLIGIAYLFSENRKAISWKVVGYGLGLQILLAIGVLQVPLIQTSFEFVGRLFVKVLDFTNEGTKFLFSSYASGVIEAPLQTFAINILPTIIFFSALTSVLFYFGIIQKIVWLLAWGMTRLLKLSGAESLSVAGNIFLGQTESPLMIKAYLEKMNRSEILLVMAGGMATLAGGVLAVYISFLGGTDPAQRLLFAKHLLSASVMAAPGVVVISKILVPQTEDINKEVKITQEKIGKNVLDAINNGTYEGLKLAVNVAAMLLVFIAFLAMINFTFIKIGDWTHLNDWISSFSRGRYHELSLQFMLGYSISPLMWLIGVNVHDITLVGSLLGEKLIMTEFVGYISLANMKASGIFTDPKSIIMATYMLCGFANFASIGIQIGGIGALAPGKRVLLAKFGMKALLAGTLASLLSATIVGVILS
ncbi:MAG: Na+ dependent nucleoside transporter [Bacteroidales bacterium]|nr:Na+ dependent nucleoside transporter [Bacteroidales bacterium]MCB8998640.1 Na+ dependent nucleoside transporter [Bacteroidales bacterium]MCB9012492.1 Na+ dependent nucleoside transporter [Bacteroidales bacterium]